MLWFKRGKTAPSGGDTACFTDLSGLPPFGVCRVTGVDECPMRERLYGLGITEGAEVVRLFSAPSGDPTAYSVRGAVVALRVGDARHIRVRGCGAWE